MRAHTHTKINPFISDIYIRKYIHIHTYTHTHIHTYIHTYIHTHTHTHTPTHTQTVVDRHWSWKTLKTKWARFCARICEARGKSATVERCTMCLHSH